MCKKNRKTTDYLLFHCAVAGSMSVMVFCLFGVQQACLDVPLIYLHIERTVWSASEYKDLERNYTMSYVVYVEKEMLKALKDMRDY